MFEQLTIRFTFGRRKTNAINSKGVILSLIMMLRKKVKKVKNYFTFTQLSLDFKVSNVIPFPVSSLCPSFRFVSMG